VDFCSKYRTEDVGINIRIQALSKPTRSDDRKEYISYRWPSTELGVSDLSGSERSLKINPNMTAQSDTWNVSPQFAGLTLAAER
jgi:hypothetical protein